MFGQDRQSLVVQTGRDGFDTEFVPFVKCEPTANERQQPGQRGWRQVGRRAPADEQRLEGPWPHEPIQLASEREKVSLDELVAPRDEREVAIPAPTCARGHVDVGGTRRRCGNGRHTRIVYFTRSGMRHSWAYGT
jgi:hypothetical protein